MNNWHSPGRILRQTSAQVLCLIVLWIGPDPVAPESAVGQETAPRALAPLEYQTQLETVLQHDDGEFLWFHPRVAAAGNIAGDGAPPVVVMTLQKHLHVSDFYSGVHFMLSRDLGRTWTPPVLPAELDWQRDGNVTVAVADVTPCWAPRAGRVIAIGAQVRYSDDGRQLEDQPRANQTAYALFDPTAEKWTTWQRLEMPEDEAFAYARCACAQFLCDPALATSSEQADEDHLLVPLYIGRTAESPFEVTVAHCRLNGTQLRYVRHGTILRHPVVRGLCEPSLVKFQNRYFLTLRNDLAGYVAVSDDGLNYSEIKPWQFDDGQELGSYNTQQHWLAYDSGLFLIYTRKGAGNDHIFRHRAPLFIAQVDPQRLCVIRSSERILIPERGATLGNFGATGITAQESWVTVAEGIWDDAARQRGALGALFLARIRW